MPGALADPTLPPPASPPSIYEPSAWVPLFLRHTPRTRFIHLPAAYLTRLLTGSVYTPHATLPTQVEWSDGTTSTLPPSAPAAAAGIESSIESHIAELGGAVSPKLSCISPLDAAWANFHRSTKCTTPDDVLALLQSSERILSRVDPTRGATLALRRWADLDDRMELRVFVRRAAVVAVAQRASETAVRFGDDEMDSFVERVTAFYERSVKHAFVGPDRFVMDVYLDRGGRTWVMDFAEWGVADALFFEWDELERAPWMGGVGRAQFRCAFRDAAIRPSQRMFDGLPLELRAPEAMGDLAEAAQRLTRAQEEAEREQREQQGR